MSWNASLPANSSLIRLSAGYIRNNESAVQSVLTQTNLENNTPFIPTGYPVYFYSDIAPTGWTLFGGVTDALLALKGGTSAYNVTGGQVVGTWNGPDEVTGSQFNGIGQVNSLGVYHHTHPYVTTRPMGAVGILAVKNA